MGVIEKDLHKHNGRFPVLGAKVAMFPLLVRLDTTMINFNSAQSLGQDIRFSRADGTHFYYEKEKWDQANKNAVLWVLVDTILPSSSTQYITMYWGKSDAVDKSNSSAVFDTANSFVAAYHFSVSDTFGTQHITPMTAQTAAPPRTPHP